MLTLLLIGVFAENTFTTEVRASDLDYKINEMVEAISEEAELGEKEKAEVIDFLKEAPTDIKQKFTGSSQFSRTYALSAVSYVRNKPEEPWVSSVSEELLYPYVVPLFFQCYEFYYPPFRELDFRPVLRELAVNITANMSDPYEVAHALCSWVYDNIEYGEYASESGTPLRTLEFRKGKCVQKAELFIALCRSIGLPARLVYIQFTTHLAAQVYISSKGWIPADPTIESYLFDVHEGCKFMYSHFWHASAVNPISTLSQNEDVTYYYSLDGLYALMNLTENYVYDQETLNSLKALLKETENAFSNQDYEEAQLKGSTLKDRIGEALPVFNLNVTFVNRENNETLPYTKFWFSAPIIYLYSSNIYGVTNENGQAEINFRPGYYVLTTQNDIYHSEPAEVHILSSVAKLLVINVTMEQYCLASGATMEVYVFDDDTDEKVSANVKFIDEDTGEQVGKINSPDRYDVLCFREPYIRRRVYILAEAPGYFTAKSTTFTVHFAWEMEPITIRISRKAEIVNDVGEPFKSPESHPYDNTAPTGSITINNDDVYTNTTSVTLTLTATDTTSGVYQVRYSTDYFCYAEQWETPSQTKSWTLTSGNGIRTVYYQIKDNAGLESIMYSDTIILDTTPPTGAIKINDGTPTTTVTVTLTLTATDETSGVVQMRFSHDGIEWSDWESYSTSKAWTLTKGDGTKTVYAQFKDNAGLISQSCEYTIFFVSNKSYEYTILFVSIYLITAAVALILWKRRK
jgi:hypothetical protein